MIFAIYFKSNLSFHTKKNKYYFTLKNKNVTSIKYFKLDELLPCSYLFWTNKVKSKSPNVNPFGIRIVTRIKWKGQIS